MYVVVAGAGEVGTWVAGFLSREGHEVAVVERSPERARQLEAELDVLVVRGSATHPRALREAGLDRADLVVALTGHDETNMAVALAVRTLASTPLVIRLTAPELWEDEAAPIRAALGAEVILDPDAETARDIVELADHPGAAEVDLVAGGAVLVLGFRLPGPVHLDAAVTDGSGSVQVVAATRAARTWFPSSGEVLEAGDLVRVLAPPDRYAAAAAAVGVAVPAPRRALLLGGREATARVAEALADRRIEVTVLQPPGAARVMAERLDRALVLEGDVAAADVLDEVAVGSFDLVAALTDRDDTNVLACLLARSRGAPITVAVVHRLGLVPLLATSGVFVAAAARTDAANAVLGHIRAGTAGIVTFLAGDAEVLEFEVGAHSRAAGTALGALGLPAGARIPVVVRGGEAVSCRPDTVLEAGDLALLVTVGGPGTGGVRRFFT